MGVRSPGTGSQKQENFERKETAVSDSEPSHSFPAVTYINPRSNRVNHWINIAKMESSRLEIKKKTIFFHE